MKLRNKETGEIGYLLVGKGSNYYIVTNDEWEDCGKYNSLAELSEDWEDYEEPKKHWFIATDGRVLECNESASWSGEKSIGNYFETKEEAEKAVEKLIAWKRLKDKGFSIDGYTNDIGDNYYMPSDFVIKLNYNGDHRKSYPDDVFKDLELLFGGEEDQ